MTLNDFGGMREDGSVVAPAQPEPSTNVVWAWFGALNRWMEVCRLEGCAVREGAEWELLSHYEAVLRDMGLQSILTPRAGAGGSHG